MFPTIIAKDPFRPTFYSNLIEFYNYLENLLCSFYYYSYIIISSAIESLMYSEFQKDGEDLISCRILSASPSQLLR